MDAKQHLWFSVLNLGHGNPQLNHWGCQEPEKLL